jgi:hypothetical protein
MMKEVPARQFEMYGELMMGAATMTTELNGMTWNHHQTRLRGRLKSARKQQR